MITQIILLIFLIFALTRVVLQLKQKHITPTAFVFWGTVFVAAMVGVIKPQVTSEIARILGIGRGADIVIYFSIAIVFYLIFRLTIIIEELRYDITKVLREIALKNVKTKKKT